MSEKTMCLICKGSVFGSYRYEHEGEERKLCWVPLESIDTNDKNDTETVLPEGVRRNDGWFEARLCHACVRGITGSAFESLLFEHHGEKFFRQVVKNEVGSVCALAADHDKFFKALVLFLRYWCDESFDPKIDEKFFAQVLGVRPKVTLDYADVAPDGKSIKFRHSLEFVEAKK